MHHRVIGIAEKGQLKRVSKLVNVKVMR